MACSSSALAISSQTQWVCNKPTDIGEKAWLFSPDFCDKTTWFADSVAVVDEAVGTGDGATTVFNLDHAHVIDLYHGNVSDEKSLTADYPVTVTVDGVAKQQKIFDNTHD